MAPSKNVKLRLELIRGKYAFKKSVNTSKGILSKGTYQECSDAINLLTPSHDTEGIEKKFKDSKDKGYTHFIITLIPCTENN